MSKKVTSIYEIADLNSKSITKDDTPNSIYYLDTSNITRNRIDNLKYLQLSKEEYPSRAKRKVKDKTIVYSTVRPNQEHFGILDNPIENLIVSTGFTTIDIKDINVIDPLYLYYYITQKRITNHLQAIAENSVSSYPSINSSDIGELIITFPLEIKEQQKKITLLSSIDKKIELNNRINAELEAMAKTLYDYWFVQFDFPNEEGKPYKSSGGKMIYNSILKREIPEGWSVDRLQSYINFKRGISYKSNEISDIQGKEFLNLNSFSLKGEFKIEGTKYFIGKYNQESLVSSGGLVVAITDVTRNADIIGKAFIIPNIFEDGALISCDVVSVTSERLNKFYLEQLFNSTYYHSYIKYYASGTLVLHLNLNGINWFNTILPPVGLLNQFEKFCKPILKKKAVILKENKQLIELRDWLLPMLMNGQVTVK